MVCTHNNGDHGDNENNCVNTTLLFLLLLSIVFIVTTQPVGVQRSTSLPTQLGSGKSKPSRILKPIQFLMVCLKIVSTPKCHNWWSCSYQNDDFCVSRSFWWLWTTINAYKGVVKAHCLGVGTIWRAYVWYLMKMGVAPNFIIIIHHHHHHHHFTKTVTQWHKLRVSPHLQLHSLLHRFGSSAVVGHGLGLATRQWRKTRGDSTHKSGERWYLRRIMKSMYIYIIHYNDYTKTMSPWKSASFLYWFLGAGKPWISHIASGSRLLFPGFHFWDGLGNNIGKSNDMWKCMKMYLSNKQCCSSIYIHI